MGKIALILTILVIFLMIPVGKLNAEINSPNAITSDPKIILNQQFSESDFFFSRYLIDPNVPYNPSEHFGLSNTAQAVEVDSQNNIIMAGTTDEPDYPVIKGYDQTFNGLLDGYITKFTENGMILWSTFLGGNKEDTLIDLKIDSEDNIVVTGYTQSSDFPTSIEAFQEDYNGSRDIFASKFSPQGDLIWSTFIGGDATDGEYQAGNRSLGGGKTKLTIDPNDNIFLGGTTSSRNFPVMNPNQSQISGQRDVYVVKLNSFGEMIWSTYYGGSLNEGLNDIMVDNDGNVIIGGSTQSKDDLPILNAHDPIPDDDWSAFLAKFSNSGSLEWSTFFKSSLGDTGRRDIESIIVNSDNHIITAGHVDRLAHSYSADVILTKYNSNGTRIDQFDSDLSIDDFSMDLTIDEEDNLYLIHYDNIDWVDRDVDTNAYFMNDFDTSYMKISKFNSSFSLQWTTDYLKFEATLNEGGGISGDSWTGPNALSVDNEGRLIIVGVTTEDNLPGSDSTLPTLTKAAPFLSIIKLDPIADSDEDSLLNYEEFKAKSSPFNSDTDGDGLSDSEEVKLLRTSPISIDSDNDGLGDKFEVDNSFNPISNDTDFDGIVDKWEFDNGLDPVSNVDAMDDFDNDGLNNLEEFHSGTDPNDADTDNDGMNDKYEVDNNLNPLADDADGDRDRDLLKNKFEHDYGLNPDSPIETVIVGLILVILMSGLSLYFIRTRRLNTLAIKQGFTDNTEKKIVESRGFSSLEGLSDAEVLGFRTKLAMTFIKSSKYLNVNEMIKGWESQIKTFNDTAKLFDLDNIADLVDETTSPINLHDVELGYEHIIEELKNIELELSSTLSLQDSLIDLPRMNNKLPLVEFSEDSLQEYHRRFKKELSNLQKTLSSFEAIIMNRKDWFEPWQPLLTLIQMTQDGLPIDLARIAEVIRCPEEQAEGLLEQLLVENSLVGTYDKSNQIYTKGTNIAMYIQSMLEKMANFGD